MKSRKAFIHVVEIVIISLVVFILVVQFSTVPRPRADWEKADLIALGGDILSSLDSKGVNWLNHSQVSLELDAALNNTGIMRDLTVRNAIKANITVGCICDDGEVSLLTRNLTPFTVNGETVTFTVRKIEPSRISFPVTYDVIILGDAAFPTAYTMDSYASEMRSYLRRGGGLVEMQDFTSQSQVVISSVQSNIFKLDWGSANPDSSTLSFTPGPASRFYNLVKYFHSITNSTGDVYPGLHTTPYSFDNSGGLMLQYSPNYVKVNTSDSLDRVILKQSNGAASLVVNDQAVDGSGRTVWMSKGSVQREDRWVLVRAAVAWAAGEDYNIVSGAMLSPSTSTLVKAVPESNPYGGIGMYQPIEIILSLGYIF